MAETKTEGLRRCKGRATMQVEGHWEKQDFALGYFHQWGVAFEEFEDGPGHYTTAIVELPDGRVIMPAADEITFLDPIEN